MKKMDENKRLAFDFSLWGDIVMKHLDCGVILLDEEGCIREMNARAETFLDTKKEVLVPLKLSLLSAMSFPDEMKQAFKMGKAFDVDLDFYNLSSFSNVSKQGKFWLNVKGFPIQKGKHLEVCFLLLLTEVCEVKKVKRVVGNEINYNHLHTKILLDTLDKAVVYIDSCARVIDVNKSFEEMFTYNRLVFHHSPMPMDDLPMLSKEMKRAVLMGEPYSAEQLMENGVFLQYKGMPILDAKGEFLGYLGMFKDRTAERLMVEELHLAKEKADVSNKMKDVFLASMSHEMRTPLNSIVGFSDLMAEMLAENEEAQGFREVIVQNNELLLRLIDDVLDFSKLETGALKLVKGDFDVFNLMQDAFAVMLPKAKAKGVDLSLDQVNHLVLCLDRKRVLQVLYNFLSNAIKFTPDGGTIVLSAYLENEGVKIEVRDNGIGIAEADFEKVFRQFEKVDMFAQGAGLGLAICKSIVELQGGKIGFTSKENEGSVFWAWFPIECYE